MLGEGSKSLLAIVPALNEEEGIGPTIDELRQHLENPTILVVDGRSRDRTVEIAKKMNVDVFLQEGKGKGSAVDQAISHVDFDVDYVILTDADYTYPAMYIPQMVHILEKNPRIGMVCGNRFNGHLDLGRMHELLFFGNRLLAFSHNLMNGVQLRDPLTGLRVLRWDILKDWKPKSKGFDIEVELNHHVERKGYGIVEIPIDYRVRLGEKKLKMKHGFVILKRILSESLS